MEPTEAQKNRVKRFIDKWRRRLFLHEWTTDTYWMKTQFEGDDGGNARVADIGPSVNYMSANIRIFPKFWTQRLKNQEEVIVHELCHCLTQELTDLCHDMRDGKLVSQKQIMDAAERLTQRITNIAFQDEW